MFKPIAGMLKPHSALLTHLTVALPICVFTIVPVAIERILSRECLPTDGAHRAYTPVADKYMLSHALSREGLGAAGLVALHPVRSRMGRRVRFHHRKFALSPLLDFA